MKGYNGSRGQSQHSSAHACHCVPEDCEQPQDYLHHSQDPRQSYLLSPTESCLMDHHYCVSRSSIPSECAAVPISMSEQMASSSTFPRMHHNLQYESCDDCMTATHGSSKINRLPANLLDQFEKQLPLHHDGFHTLQYQRASSAEQRSESPSRIRHLVHSVQKLFAKSHSLEAPSKGNINGTRMDGRGGENHHHHHPRHHHPHHHHQHQSRSIKRSKSKDRRSESKHRAKMAGWWSSDDNLDSDSSYLVTSAAGRHSMEQATQYCAEPMESAFRDLTLKSLKSSSEGKCLACAAMPLKRRVWSTMTVSQAREVYPSSATNPEKPPALQETKMQERAYHYLQVPQDDWAGGYPVVTKDGEIPCRRMRSGSYIKAMGDDESVDSDASQKMSPKGASQQESYLQPGGPTSSEQRHSKFSCKHCSEPYICSHACLQGQTSMNYSLDNLHRSSLRPKLLPRSQAYSRMLSTNHKAGEVDVSRQFEVVCESVFGEVESQAVEALDLPGCFRMRSHSYLRAIQAGCSQDDDCLPRFSMAPIRPPIAVSARKPSVSFNYKKAPPVPPRMAIKPLISVTAQSSTESTQDTYPSSEPHRPIPWSRDIRSHCNSTDSLNSSKALTMALELSAPIRSSMKTSSGAGVYKGILSRDEPKLEPRQRKWRSSVGIQVDSSETMTDSDTESRCLREVHSIGVQVEDDKRHARFKRSNSVTTSVQADLELEEMVGLAGGSMDKGFQFGRPFQRHSSDPEPPSEYTSFRTVHTQGQWAYREDYHVRSDSDGQRPDTWAEAGTHSLTDTGRASPCHRDGDWFIKLLQAEVERLEAWCQQMEREAEENDLPEEVLEKIRSAVGSAQLLMSQKFQQFFRLCQQNMDPNAFPLPTSQDLAGFWDLLQLSVEDVTLKFDELLQIKSNNWVPIDMTDKPAEKKIPHPSIPKKPLRGKLPPTRERSLEVADKQRQEARKRLMAAKRAASFRQNSATESADSIEIYIPEAHTRL